jgi:hypothetical protein
MKIDTPFSFRRYIDDVMIPRRVAIDWIGLFFVGVIVGWYLGGL